MAPWLGSGSSGASRAGGLRVRGRGDVLEVAVAGGRGEGLDLDGVESVLPGEMFCGAEGALVAVSGPFWLGDAGSLLVRLIDSVLWLPGFSLIISCSPFSRMPRSASLDVCECSCSSNGLGGYPYLTSYSIIKVFSVICAWRS